MKIKYNIKKNWFLIAAVIFPWAIALSDSVTHGTWIFGSGHILRGDMMEQLLPFYYELWERVHSGNMSLFTWNIAGGMSFISIMGYLISPFSLIVLAVPRHMIMDVLQFIMIAKWSLISFGMVYFFYNTKYNTLNEHKKLVALFLGLAYALNNGMINFVGYVQLNDVMICLPFLLLLIEKMIDEKKWKLYYLLLSWCIISTAYICFGVCILLFMWFVLVSIYDGFDIKAFKLFVGSSVLAAVNVCFNIIPVFFTKNSRIGFSGNKDYIFSVLISPITFLKQLFIFNDIPLIENKTPNIYFSIIAVVLVALYCFILVDKKKKLWSLAFLLFVGAAFFLGPLSFVWHCFTVPNGLYHRFSNYFVFLALFIAMQVLIHLNDIKADQVIKVFVVIIVGMLVVFFNIKVYGSFLIYLVTFLLVVLYGILLYMHTKKSIEYKKILLVLSLFGIAELCINGYNAFAGYQFDETYIDSQNALQRITDNIDLEPGERFSSSMYCNPGLIASLPSEDGFISGINPNNRNLHVKLGMPYNSQVQYSISGASPVINQIYNVRYIADIDEAAASDAQLIDTIDELSLYRINNLTGVGYMTEPSILKWNIDEGNCFDVQNDFINKTTGIDSVFKEINIEPEIYSSIDSTDVGPLEYNEDSGLYTVEGRMSIGGMDEYLCSEFVVDKDMDLYIYTRTNNLSYIGIFCDGSYVHADATSYIQNTFHAGRINKGQTVQIYCIMPYSLPGDVARLEFALAEFDEESFLRAYDQLGTNVLEVDEFLDDHIKGHIDVENDGIMCTTIQAIPWLNVYVDGVKTEYNAIGNALIGIPLSKGKHVVELAYEPIYMPAALIISLISWIAFIVICIMDKQKGKKLPEDITDGSIL